MESPDDLKVLCGRKPGEALDGARTQRGDRRAGAGITLPGVGKISVNRTALSLVLLGSLTFTNGCYDSQTISREQLTPVTKAAIEAEADHLDITVFTKDSLVYTFLKGQYRVHSDTLTGSGVQALGGQQSSPQSHIPLADITSLKTEEFSLSKSVFAAIMLGGLSAVIYGLMAIHANF